MVVEKPPSGSSRLGTANPLRPEACHPCLLPIPPKPNAGGPGLNSWSASALRCPFFGLALMLGTEPHWYFERTGPEVFRLTGSNHFAGYRFYTRTIEGVEGVSESSGYSKTRRNSTSDRQVSRSPHLTATGANGAQMSWGRESDSPSIATFMRSDAPSLLLIDRPAWWAQALTWLSLPLGTFLLLRAGRSFFPKK